MSRLALGDVMHDDICFLDATALAGRIRAKGLSPVEVLRAYGDRVAAVNPRLNAIVTLNPDAGEAARAAEAAVMRGEPLGPLHGVPFTVKDSIDVAGLRSTRGSRLFADHVPTTTATAVARLLDAGAILLGITNIPEFAFLWETDNLVFGRTLNPWNPDRIAGGSSGGEAAALAAGLSALGLGSDVGGSIRQPAHCCGVIGLKPTHGRVPLTGSWPPTLSRAMHVGPLARSVRDCSLAIGVLAGPDAHDPYALPVPPPAAPDPSTPLSGLRVGWHPEAGAAPVDADVQAAVARAADRLAELGCQVERVTLQALHDTDCNALTMTLYAVEGAAFFARAVAGRHDQLHPALQRRLAFTAESMAAYSEAYEAVEELKRGVASYFRSYDIFLCPCSPLPAHGHGARELRIEGQVVTARHALRATLPWDLTGSPALAVAFCWSRDRLPIAVQVVGRHFEEATILRVGMALEAHSDVVGKRPALA